MLQQPLTKIIAFMFGNLNRCQAKFAIVFLSLLIVACGGNSRPSAPPEPGPDGVPPELTGDATAVSGTRPVSARAVNKCNLGTQVKRGHTVLVEVNASESILPPDVTIAGQKVPMVGKFHAWTGEYVFDLENNSFGNPFADDEEIPYTISVTDSSGEVSQPFSPASADQLKFCDPFAGETTITNNAGNPGVWTTVGTDHFYTLTVHDNQFLVLDRKVKPQKHGENTHQNFDTGGSDSEYGTITEINCIRKDNAELIDCEVAGDDNVPIEDLKNITIKWPGANANAASGGNGGSLLLEDPGKCACYPEDISGIWKLAPKARAMGVGQSEGNTGDWSSTDFHLSQRDCVFDDTYTFTVDPADPSKKKGSFEQEMQNWTWLEPWQSGDVERCGIPQTPFDGSTEDMTYEWDRDLGTLTLRGVGAHIALPRVANDEENTGTPVDQVVYTLETANECFISLNIKSGGPSPWWHFEIQKFENLDGTLCEAGEAAPPTNPAAPAPPIFSTNYDGMPADDRAVYGLTSFSTSENALDQPTLEALPDDTGYIHTVSSPSSSGFIYDHEEEPKLFDYQNAIAGQAFLDAEQALNVAVADAVNVVNLAETAATDVRDWAISALDAIALSDPNSDDEVNAQGIVDTIQNKLDNGVADDIAIVEGGLSPESVASALTSLASKLNDVLDHAQDMVTLLSVDEPSHVVINDNSTSVFNTLNIEAVAVDTHAVDIYDAIQLMEDSTYYTNKFAFGNGGYVYFKGWLPDESTQVNNPVELYFRFEHYAVDPLTGEFTVEQDAQGNDHFILVESFDTDPITVEGSEVGFWGVKIDSQLGLSANSISLIINTEDQPVIVKDLRVISTLAGIGDGRGPYYFTNVISGGPLGSDPAVLPQIVISNEGKTYNVPSVYFADPDGDGSIDNPGAYAVFAPDEGAVNDFDFSPLTFGAGGKITFTASVPSGTADVRFRLEKIGSDNPLETEPSCTIPAEITSNVSTTYEIDVPIQGRRTFKNMVLYIDTPDMDVTVSDIRVSTSPVVTDVDPVDCGSLAALYGDKELDMTGPFGDATIDTKIIDGEETAFFRVPSAPSNPVGYAGYAVLDAGGETLLEQVPAAFGSGGKIAFTASIPESQEIDGVPITNAQTSVDLQFKFERQASEANNFCEIEPSYTTEVISVSGAEQLYEIDVPAQGSNTFANFIMFLLTEDTQVQISNITVTTTEPEDGVPEIPESCLATPDPSQYFSNLISADDFDGDGIPDDTDTDKDNDGVSDDQDDYDYTSGFYAQDSIAAVFTGTYGGENGGSNTSQHGDEFTFPNDAAEYGGWSNDNDSFYPMAFNSFLNGPSRIAFCAKSPEAAATVSFKLENAPFPGNSIQVPTDTQVIPADDVIRPYIVTLTNNNISGEGNAVVNTNVPSEFYSLQMYIAERDVPVMIGKVRGNWDFAVVDGAPVVSDLLSNGLNMTADDLAAIGYCDDFPNPDADADGIKDNLDLFPNDDSRAGLYDFDDDGVDDLLDSDIDGDGILNEWDDDSYFYDE